MDSELIRLSGLQPALDSLQPAAIGAAAEAMKLPEPLMERIASGDLASVQALKNMNAARTRKGRMQKQTRRKYEEDQRRRRSGRVLSFLPHLGGSNNSEIRRSTILIYSFHYFR